MGSPEDTVSDQPLSHMGDVAGESSDEPAPSELIGEGTTYLGHRHPGHFSVYRRQPRGEFATLGFGAATDHLAANAEGPGSSQALSRSS
jgi:hypothetical protein